MIQDVWGKLRTLNDQGVLDALVALGGRVFYVSPQGSDSGNGSITNPFLTLTAAYSVLRSGKNDAIVISQDWIDGLTDASASCTIRVDAAFVWSKPATHLVGLNPSFTPVVFAPRARLAPTPATTAFANFFTVTGMGCMFRGVEWFHDFTTDTTAQIAVTVKGARNVFQHCMIAGNANDDAAARSLVLSEPTTGNKGENYFEECTIGQDSIVRTQASGILGLIGTQVPRNYFNRCRFLSWATAAAPFMVIAGAAAIDRFVYFENCKFINFGTALTSLTSVGASQNGKLLYENPARFNCGNYGDTANSLIVGAVTVNTSGLGTAPAA